MGVRLRVAGSHFIQNSCRWQGCPLEKFWVHKLRYYGAQVNISALARFLKFLMTDIFPGGQLPTIEMVQEGATKAGFDVTRIQSLQPHYARTLDSWAEALESHKDEAIALQSEEVYDRYVRYLTGCANGFRAGNSDVNQFTLEK